MFSTVTFTWVAFLLYSAAAIGLGVLAARRQGAGSADGHDGAEFWTAGRSLNATSVGLSISAGFLSVSWSCVYAVQLFYWYGLGALWLITVPWLLALAGIYWLSRRYHALAEFSQPEMVGRRFGPAARRLVALALAFVFLVWGGAEIYVAAELLAPSMAVSPAMLIALIALVVAAYSMLGGFRAVVSTDKLQYAIVALYIAVMAVLAWRGLSARPEGAWAALFETPVPAARSDLPWTRWLGPGLATIALTLVAYLPGWLFETDLWLRVQAARDGRAARRGVLLAAVNGLLFVGVLPLFIGAAALVLFPLENGAYPAAIGVEGEGIFAALVAQLAPGWLAVAVAVGLVAAAMSTIDTCVNVVALSVAYDLMAPSPDDEPGPASRPASSPAADARRSRWVTLAAVAAAALFALFTESLWDLFYLSSGVLTTAVAFPVAAVFLPRVGRRAVVASSAAGLAGTVLAYFLESRGALAALQPAWLTDTGVGFILWGCAAAVAGGVFGAVAGRPPTEVAM
jgi:Na+/proline symporter